MTEIRLKKVNAISTTSPIVAVPTHQEIKGVAQKRIRKKCLGCCDNFTCYKSKNYDYCSSCEINGSRYVNKDSPCSECDGFGLIKFKNQPVRNCKLGYLAQQEQRENNIFVK
jgi:hypothetical protein